MLHIKYFSPSSVAARLCYKTISWRRRGRIGKIVSRYFRDRLIQKYGLFVSPLAVLGKNIFFPHPVAIVIGDGVTIGNDVTIYQSVTLGVKGDGSRNYPVVGSGVVIYAGAVIIGSVKIGKNAVVAANSVVLHDVAEGDVVGGVPARSLKVRADVSGESK